MQTFEPRTPYGVSQGLRTPAILSTVLVLPFLFLEVVNRTDSREAFPVALFGTMWLLALSFCVALLPVARMARENGERPVTAFALLPRVVVALLVAGVWISLVLDQMPCFLGVPNCD